MKNNNEGSLSFQSAKNAGSSSNEVIQAIITMAIIIVLLLASIQILKSKFKDDISASLQNLLSVTEAGFEHEKEKQLRIIQLHAQSEEVVQITEQLLTEQTTNQTHNNSVQSQASPLNQLRHYFSADLTEKRHLGFYIISPENITIASAHDQTLGKKTPLTSQADLLERMWSGQATLTKMQHSDTKIIDQHGNNIVNPTTLFAGAPIRNSNNDIIALLTLSINPYDELFPLLEKEHLGETGETYAFDKNGIILSHSRFERKPKKVLPLETDPIKHLESSQAVNPILTEMANNANNIKPGQNIEGYQNYRGIGVVGAWRWFPEVDMGIATEQDLTDAYRTYFFTRNLVLLVGVIGCVLTLFYYTVSYIRRRNAVSSQAYLNAIYKASHDALIVIDKYGIIQRCNPTTEKLFGHSVHELIGKNINILMPEPYHSEHDGYLAHYRKFEDTPSKRPPVVNFTREVSGIKADGTVFPIELTVTQLDLVDGRYIAGCIHDISARVLADAAVKDSRLHLKNALKHAPIGTWEWRLDTKKIVHSGYTARAYGLTKQFPLEQITTSDEAEFKNNVHPEDRDIVKKAVRQAHNTENTVNIEYRVIWPDKTVHWIHAEGSVFFDEEKRPTGTMGIVQDITERKHLEHEVQEAESVLIETKNNLINILDTAPVNIFIKNLKGEYTFVNPAWEKCLNKNAEDVMGKTVFDLLPKETAQRFHDNQQLVITSGEPVRLEEEFINTNGQYTAFMTNLFPLKNTEGEIYAIGGWSSIITEMKKAQKELEDARRNADASNEAKSYFLAAMSHEIRTPMNGVVGIIDVLRYTSLDEQQQKLVKTVNDSALSLLAIIDDILDFSKVDAGKTVLEEIPISLEEIVDSAGETLLPLSAKKGIELITYCEPNLPNFYGDAVRIRQILYNIGGNAIKFTGNDSNSSGRVVIRCEQANVSSLDGTVQLNLSIEDNGIGMPEEVQKNLFNPFSQAESSTTREYGGTGLGLAISKSLCELMGGKIEVESHAGVGSTFTVSILLKPVETDAVAHTHILQGKHILLVKGKNTVNAVNQILATYLKAEGVQLHETDPNDIIPPLVSLEDTTPSTLVVVIDTEGKDNEVDAIKSACKQQMSDVAQLHFVVVSRGMRRRARTQGDDTVQLDLNCLSRRIFLNTVASAAGLISPDISKPGDNDSTSTQPIVPSFTTKKNHHLLLIAEDNPINQRVITHQLTLLGFTAEMANDGQEALDMWVKSKGKYSLLLSDCHMPNMDGYTLASSIRQQEKEGERFPIIALTADAMSGAKKICLDAGMDDYITKPLQIDTLSKKLAEWLPDIEEHQNQEAEPIAEDSVTIIEPSIDAGDAGDAIDASILPEMLCSDEPSLLSEFYHEFLVSAIPIVDEICIAIEEQDMKNVVSQSHKLKSSAYTVGATALADCCLLLETSGKLGEQDVLDDNLSPLKLLMTQTHDWVFDKYPSH